MRVSIREMSASTAGYGLKFRRLPTSRALKFCSLTTWSGAKSGSGSGHFLAISLYIPSSYDLRSLKSNEENLEKVASLVRSEQILHLGVVLCCRSSGSAEGLWSTTGTWSLLPTVTAPTTREYPCRSAGLHCALSNHKTRPTATRCSREELDMQQMLFATDLDLIDKLIGWCWLTFWNSDIFQPYS